MKTYLATTTFYPIIGKRLYCFVSTVINGVPSFVDKITSAVIKVEVRDDNIYEVYTKHSLYIVKYVPREK